MNDIVEGLAAAFRLIVTLDGESGILSSHLNFGEAAEKFGKVGGFEDYFTPEQVAEIDRLVNDTLAPRYGYGGQAVVEPE